MGNIANGLNSTTIILVAENNDGARQNYKDILSDAGFLVVLAATPQEASRVLMSGKINLAIVDWRLEDDADENDDSGLEIVREFGDAVPMILMTIHERGELEMLKLIRLKIGQDSFDYFMKGRESSSLISVVNKILDKRKVFIVHGRNQVMLDQVSQFLIRLNLIPRILQDLPGEGCTIIEKLERYSDVNYTVVLLTADDRGALKTEAHDLKFRARQNVIMELGLFIGKLGRSRISILREENVEIPSDLNGIEYIMLEGHWQQKLEQEMQNSNIL